MRYLDTSLLVAALTNEEMTDKAQRWLAAQPAGSLAISDWVVTEFSAALSIKLREKLLDREARADILAAFARLAEENLEVWAVTRTDYRTAARFADQHVTGLRAGDALHLAIAAGHGASVCTLDRAMTASARALGIGTASPA